MNRISKFLTTGTLTAGAIVGSAEIAEAAKLSSDKTSVLVERGDTLTTIARVSGLPASKIIEINRIANPDRIYAGQRLRLVEKVDPNALVCPGKIEVQADITPGCTKVLLGKLASAGYLDATANPRLAVRAYQTLNSEQHLKVDGRLGPLTATALVADTELLPSIAPQITNGIEVDVSDQVARYVMDGAIKGLVAVTTGSGKPYSELGSDGKIHSGTATTPLGVFTVGRTKGEDYISALGDMPYATFLHQGKWDTAYAIHGGVVNTSGTDGLSHGCIRVDDALFAQQFLINTPHSEVAVHP